MEIAAVQVIDEFITHLKDSIKNQEFVKLTLSKPSKNEKGLQNVYVRLVSIKQASKLSFTYRHNTNDQVKNFDIEEATAEIRLLLKDSFKIATLFTTTADFVLLIPKKGKLILKKSKASFSEPGSDSHDREKKKRASDNDAYLQILGITDDNGAVIPKMADKFRQINKYLEIIEGLIKEASLPAEINIVDMGSGKGYLTFALHDYLHHKLELQVNVLGIDQRQDLIDYCNKAAKQCGFDKLRFECRSIDDFKEKNIDILIALHACDTATDDAIQKGIDSNAALIICAPCCHKQIRQQLKGKEQRSPLLKYGIFKERQFELVTDTIRALIMEKNQYETKIFEFISNEHTRKNVMLIGIRSEKKPDEKAIDNQITNLKKEYGIEYHYLEKILDHKK
jgi:2-polyprenyl-3-methyl-5-hydroxy-6-metoxy-1,4-benzoquinol methylase